MTLLIFCWAISDQTVRSQTPHAWAVWGTGIHKGGLDLGFRGRGGCSSRHCSLMQCHDLLSVRFGPELLRYKTSLTGFCGAFKTYTKPERRSVWSASCPSSYLIPNPMPGGGVSGFARLSRRLSSPSDIPAPARLLMTISCPAACQLSRKASRPLCLFVEKDSPECRLGFECLVRRAGLKFCLPHQGEKKYVKAILSWSAALVLIAGRTKIGGHVDLPLAQFGALLEIVGHAPPPISRRSRNCVWSFHRVSRRL